MADEYLNDPHRVALPPRINAPADPGEPNPQPMNGFWERYAEWLVTPDEYLLMKDRRSA